MREKVSGVTSEEWRCMAMGGGGWRDEGWRGEGWRWVEKRDGGMRGEVV